jgi:regulator of nucleoside diphosphate kinase
MTMSNTIFIGAAQAARLRGLVEQHLEGRDGSTAARLAEELDRAIILEDARVPSDVAAIGSRVRFADESTGSTRDVVLVYPSDADASAGRISVLAPVGAALIGLRAGDRIEWPLPGGRTARIRIAAVEPDTPSRREVAA